MSELKALEANLEATRLQFLTIIQDIRPDLHKYCSRMMGAVLDGEDVVQETLAQAYYKLSMLKEDVPLRPWLFKIAHNKCIDFLRRRQLKEVPLEEQPEVSTIVAQDRVERQEAVAQALSTLVQSLPPKERACVILKDVLDYSLAEIAEILETSVPAVKAALHRGRGKLKKQTPRLELSQPEPSEMLTVFVDLFNRRDWEGVKALMRADAQCDVFDMYVGLNGASIERRYLRTYATLDFPWRMAPATVDGEPVVVCLQQEAQQWVFRAVIRLEWVEGRIKGIRDYTHVPYMFDEAEVILQEMADD